MISMTARHVIARKTTLQEMDGSFDREFWAQVPPEEKVRRVWELSYDVWKMTGRLPGEQGRPRATARVLRPPEVRPIPTVVLIGCQRNYSAILDRRKARYIFFETGSSSCS